MRIDILPMKRRLVRHGLSAQLQSRPHPCTAAAIASPISLVLAFPPRSRVRCLRVAITWLTPAWIRPAAAIALGSLRLRPSQASSICPDMIMAYGLAMLRLVRPTFGIVKRLHYIFWPHVHERSETGGVRDPGT